MKTRIVLSVGCFLSLFCSVLCAGPAVDNTAYMYSGYHTDISPALANLIEQTLKDKKSKDALKILDTELQKDPRNITLLYKRASIEADIEKYSDALNDLRQIAQVQPDNKEANKLRVAVEQKKSLLPHNELGFDQDEAYVSDLKAYWTYSSLHYFRLTDAGNFGGRINFAKRYGTTGFQYQLEAYPKITRNIYATLLAAYANTTQILYPSLMYYAEIYADVGNGFEFSLGQGTRKFIRFSNQKILTFTGSIGKYLGSNFIWFRPNYYTPKQTWFYEVGARHYFSNENNYVSIKLNTGRLPDIGDVPPFDQMLVINQKNITLAGQVELKKSLFLRVGAGFAKQVFPSGLTRELTDGALGIVWQF